MKKEHVAGYFVLIFVISIWAVFATGWLMVERKLNKIIVKEAVTKQVVKQAEIDSLTSECWVKDIEIGRYEIIIDRIAEVDSGLVEEAKSNIE